VDAPRPPHLSTVPPASGITLHGVLMEIFGLGVLLTGASGVGKSELALELISRGQRLIADDAPQFQVTADHTLQGACPALLHNFISVRGLGTLNIAALFGAAAVAQQVTLNLILRLEALPAEAHPSAAAPTTSNAPRPSEPLLNPVAHPRTVLGVAVPEYVLTMQPGRPMALLVECLVRNHLLQLNGYHAAEDFMMRQGQRISHAAAPNTEPAPAANLVMPTSTGPARRGDGI